MRPKKEEKKEIEEIELWEKKGKKEEESEEGTATLGGPASPKLGGKTVPEAKKEGKK